MELLTSSVSLRSTASPEGKPYPQPSPLGKVARRPEEVPSEISSEVLSLRTEVHELRTLILSQNALLEQLAQRQAQIRVSRSQEKALRAAVRMRAEELAASEDLPGRAISSAILSTVRELSACRALGDAPAEKFDALMESIRRWYMPGALRRIRRRISST